MSEKRFNIKIDDIYSTIINITDSNDDFAWFLSDVITDKQVEKVVALLNELSDENGQLKYDNEAFKGVLKCSKHRFNKLKEENEQLKEEHKVAIDEMITDYKELEKENEQLKILLITEVVPQLIFLTGLTDFNGKEINFSSLIEKIEKVCDVV